MSFFDSVKETVTNAGTATASKAKELAEITKLKNAIATKEREIKDAYEEIGKLYYETHKDAQEVGFSDAIDQIDAAKQVIAQKQAELNEVKNVKICPNCGSVIDEGSMFCAKCGQSVSAQ
jgi:rubrerythrin